MAEIKDGDSTAKEASGKTGVTCEESGPYYAGRNAKVIVFFRKGQPFPLDVDGSPTTWTLIREGQRLSDGVLESESTPRV